MLQREHSSDVCDLASTLCKYDFRKGDLFVLNWTMVRRERLVFEKCECFVRQMLYVCVLCASCGRSQCCVLHDLQFVNAGRGCKRRPYGRGNLQRLSHDCLVGSHVCLRLLTPSCCGECFYYMFVYYMTFECGCTS